MTNLIVFLNIITSDAIFAQPIVIQNKTLSILCNKTIIQPTIQLNFALNIALNWRRNENPRKITIFAARLMQIYIKSNSNNFSKRDSMTTSHPTNSK